MSDYPTLVIRESYIADGRINATVSIDDVAVGAVYLDLSQWATLRSLHRIKVMNLAEVTEEENTPEEES